jgi:hypothetical protein
LGRFFAIALATDDVRLEFFQNWQELGPRGLLFDEVHDSDLMVVSDLSREIT